MGLGWSSQGYRPERWLRQRCVLLLGDENRKRLTRRLVMTRCDIVIMFRSWSLLQLIYFRTLNANFLVSAAICGSSCGNKANFGSLPTKTVNLKRGAFRAFQPWVGCRPQLGRRDQQVCCFCAVRTSPCWTGRLSRQRDSIV